jgi:hypothetical protein
LNQREVNTKNTKILAFSEKYTVWVFLLEICPDQGDIVGREYIISSKFMPPYGILLADSTIVVVTVLASLALQKYAFYCNFSPLGGDKSTKIKL